LEVSRSGSRAAEARSSPTSASPRPSRRVGRSSRRSPRLERTLPPTWCRARTRKERFKSVSGLGFSKQQLSEAYRIVRAPSAGFDLTQQHRRQRKHRTKNRVSPASSPSPPRRSLHVNTPPTDMFGGREGRRCGGGARGAFGTSPGVRQRPTEQVDVPRLRRPARRDIAKLLEKLPKKLARMRRREDNNRRGGRSRSGPPSADTFFRFGGWTRSKGQLAVSSIKNKSDGETRWPQLAWAFCTDWFCAQASWTGRTATRAF